MKTAVLEMTVQDATKELARWRPGRNREDILIARAFRTVARGGKVIDLHESFRRSGCDSQGRPRLAISRADATMVMGNICDLRYNPSVVRMWVDVGYKNEVQIPLASVPNWRPFYAKAKVPIIPPIYRRRNLAGYFILFEAAWENVTKDPILLQHLGGALYRVIASWDLTPIEQAVLRARR